MGRHEGVTSGWRLHWRLAGLATQAVVCARRRRTRVTEPEGRQRGALRMCGWLHRADGSLASWSSQTNAGGQAAFDASRAATDPGRHAALPNGEQCTVLGHHAG